MFRFVSRLKTRSTIGAQTSALGSRSRNFFLLLSRNGKNSDKNFLDLIVIRISTKVEWFVASETFYTSRKEFIHNFLSYPR